MCTVLKKTRAEGQAKECVERFSKQEYITQSIQSDANKINCTGRTPGVLIMATLMFTMLLMAIFALIVGEFGAEGYFVMLLDIAFFVVAAIYYVLYWKNKKIILSDSEIVYYTVSGKRKSYSWYEVKDVRYKSGGRGPRRIMIMTDCKIYIETGMMKECDEAEKLIKEKGFLQKK